MNSDDTAALHAAPGAAPATDSAVPMNPKDIPASVLTGEPDVPPQHHELHQVLSDKHNRAGVADFVTTGTLAAGAVAASFALRPTTARVQGGVLFDNQGREILRADSVRGRARADVISDALAYSLVAYPYLVDAGTTTLINQGNGRLALKLTLIDTQAFALTTLASVATKSITARERPFAGECESNGSYSSNCGDSSGSTGSFFSGHTATAFTGAGLICWQHEELVSYGSDVADRAACYTSLAAASATGVLRVVADEHYVSDIIVGAAVGAVSGYLLPKLLYAGTLVKPKRRRPSGNRNAASAALAPFGSPKSAGVRIVGRW